MLLLTVTDVRASSQNLPSDDGSRRIFASSYCRLSFPIHLATPLLSPFSRYVPGDFVA